MDIQKEELDHELNRIKEKINNANPLNVEDLKIILLSILNEEHLHESKQ